MQLEHFVGNDTGDEEVAAFFSVLEEIEVPDVEQIESAHCIANPGHVLVLPVEP